MTGASSSNLLQGLRLFVVEDEALVAILLEDMLADLGCVVTGVAGSIHQALTRIDAVAAEADGAILDVNIGGEKVYPVADALAERGVPFMFATGYGSIGLGDRYPQAVVLAKPYGPNALASALSGLVAERRAR